uniref:Uncharacterized protein LOC102805024 n=1 Tax=Saccoglossus kowalevskii TaxID=10224 RepID=A0ABM0MQU9_SACKO|nr:PREDICTED: uncharacterized protein LOC102805024 [Saccoglossus kowalevskii]
MKKIEDLTCSTNPQEFWKTINKLTHQNEKSRVQQNSHQTWIEHFQEPSKNKVTTKEQQVALQEKLKLLEQNKSVDTNLNKEIKLKEILYATKKLKNKKSCGPDSIPGEMLKYNSTSMKDALKKLFNHVLQTGEYPNNWNVSLLSPLHKQSDKHD